MARDRSTVGHEPESASTYVAVVERVSCLLQYFGQVGAVCLRFELLFRGARRVRILRGDSVIRVMTSKSETKRSAILRYPCALG